MKYNFITIMLLRTTTLVVAGAFLFNLVYANLAWALRPRAAIERENSSLISPADYPTWVIQSMENAQTYLFEIKKITRRIVSIMRRGGFEPANQMASLDEAISQWERLRATGASLDEFNRFAKIFHDGFGDEITTVFEKLYAAVRDKSSYADAKLQAHKRTFKHRVAEVIDVIDEVHKLKIYFEKIQGTDQGRSPRGHPIGI